jgi:hypothetical protein
VCASIDILTDESKAVRADLKRADMPVPNSLEAVKINPIEFCNSGLTGRNLGSAGRTIREKKYEKFWS